MPEHKNVQTLSRMDNAKDHITICYPFFKVLHLESGAVVNMLFYQSEIKVLNISFCEIYTGLFNLGRCLE